METLAYLYFTEAYEETDPASPTSLDQPTPPTPNLSDNTTATTRPQPTPMQPTGYDPKLEAQPSWMML